MDFTDLHDASTALGRYLAEEFSVALTEESSSMEVIDRDHLRELVREHKLSQSGLTDPRTAAKLGQIVGVDVLVTGTLTPFGDFVRASVKAISVRTARIVGAETVDIPKTRAIEDLLNGAEAPTARNPAPQSSEREPGPNERPALPTAAPPNRQIFGQTAQSMQGMVYEVISCRAAANSMDCTFRVTNRGADRELWHWFSHCKAYDNEGSEAKAVSGSIGDERDTFQVHRMTASGVAVTANIQFEPISPTASTVSALRLEGMVVTDERFRAPIQLTFRNIPIQR